MKTEWAALMPEVVARICRAIQFLHRARSQTRQFVIAPTGNVTQQKRMTKNCHPQQAVSAFGFFEVLSRAGRIRLRGMKIVIVAIALIFVALLLLVSVAAVFIGALWPFFLLVLGVQTFFTWKLWVNFKILYPTGKFRYGIADLWGLSVALIPTGWLVKFYFEIDFGDIPMDFNILSPLLFLGCSQLLGVFVGKLEYESTQFGQRYAPFKSMAYVIAGGWLGPAAAPISFLLD